MLITKFIFFLAVDRACPVVLGLFGDTLLGEIFSFIIPKSYI